MSIKKVTYDDAVNNRITDVGYFKPRIVVIPAHNEQDSIKSVLSSLEKQDLPKVGIWNLRLCRNRGD